MLAWPGSSLGSFEDKSWILLAVTILPFVSARAGCSVAPGGSWPADALSMAAQVLHLAAQSVMPTLAHADIDQTAYPLDRCYPVDSKPILGFVTNGPTAVYVSVMHSGVTLAPTIGNLIAQEICQGIQVPDFEPYRVTRNFSDHTYKY